MRRSILLVIVAGCVGAADPAPPHPTDLSHVRLAGAALQSEPPDVCSLAAQLPADDICSLMCDPDAVAAQLVADGDAPGTCYELLCTLPDATQITVGVCLPPPPG